MQSSKKKDTYQVPPATTNLHSQRWVRYIYTTLTHIAPDVLQREDIRNAYNELVEYLKELDTNESIQFMHQPLNTRTIFYLQNKEFIPMFDIVPSNSDLFLTVKNGLHTHFQKLYQLYENDVVPKINEKMKSTKKQQRMSQIKHAIKKIEARIDKEHLRCEKAIQRAVDRQQALKEKRIEKIQTELHQKIEELRQYVEH